MCFTSSAWEDGDFVHGVRVPVILSLAGLRGGGPRSGEAPYMLDSSSFSGHLCQAARDSAFTSPLSAAQQSKIYLEPITLQPTAVADQSQSLVTVKAKVQLAAMESSNVAYWDEHAKKYDSLYNSAWCRLRTTESCHGWPRCNCRRIPRFLISGAAQALYSVNYFQPE